MKCLNTAATMALVATFCAPTAVSAQSVPNALVYTGLLTYSDSGAGYQGPASVEFALHMEATTGPADPPIWATDTAVDVEVQNGVFSVVLESGGPVAVTDAVLAGANWLQITIDGNALSPRQRIVSVPFALRAAVADTADTAANADAIGGVDSGEVVTNAILDGLEFATESYVQSQGFTVDTDLDAYLPRNGGQPMTGALDMGGQAIVNAGTVAAAAPISGTHAATKSYVDAIVATAASAGSGGGEGCYYMTDSTSCGPGYAKMPGRYKNDGTSHEICCRVSNQQADLVTGYFVLTHAQFTGDFGGLAGANAACLTELQTKPWLGHDQATLTSANVRAFLCDTTICQDPLPNTVYRFARANNLTAGGGSFATDPYGRGPGDTNSWAANSNLFGQTSDYWAGSRDNTFANLWGISRPEDTGSSQCCEDWTTQASSGRNGNTNSTSAQRWNEQPIGCATSLRLVCMVDPIPD